MASAYFDEDRGHWIADFRGLHQTGKQRRRVRLPDRVATKEAAVAWSEECFRLCRLLEVAAVGATIQHAENLGAITPAQTQALLTGQPPPAQGRQAERMTIEAAAMAHPATKRDAPARRWEYLLILRRFCAHSGLHYVGDITLAHVQAWIDYLRVENYAYWTRQHYCRYVRRACRMATAEGLPDVLAGIRLDREDRKGAPDIWTLPELLNALVSLKEHPRARLAIALQGFLGLSPSECWRLRCGDLDDNHALSVGKWGAKNAFRGRSLPTPTIIATWWKDLASRRSLDGPLLLTASRRHKPQAFDIRTGNQWLAPIMEKTTGRRLSAKHLRKSFATWAYQANLEPLHVEAFMGHASPLIAAVTKRHYLGAWLSQTLKPTSDAINRIISDALKPVATKTVHRKRKSLKAQPQT